MLKKIIFIPFCLSLFCSSLAHGEKHESPNIVEELSQDDLKIVAQEFIKSIEELSSEEKNIIKDSLIDSMKQTANNAGVARILETIFGTIGAGISLVTWLFIYGAIGGGIYLLGRTHGEEAQKKKFEQEKEKVT